MSDRALTQAAPIRADPVHATLVACFSRGACGGVLLRGPSGAGKSALALALIGRGWRLVADDRVILWGSGGRLWGRAPAALSGLLEVRGVGVLSVPALTFVEIVAVIDARTLSEARERIPGPAVVELLGVPLPLGRLDLAAPCAADRAAAFCDALRV